MALKGKGIKDLFKTVIEVYQDKNPSVRHIHVNYGRHLEQSIQNIQTLIKNPENYNLTDLISSRFLAIKLLENDKESQEKSKKLFNAKEIKELVSDEQETLSNTLKEEPETIVADARYAFIGGALKETLKPGRSKKMGKCKYY